MTQAVTSFFGTDSKCVNPALPSVRLVVSVSFMFLSFHVESNWILVDYAIDIFKTNF